MGSLARTIDEIHAAAAVDMKSRSPTHGKSSAMLSAKLHPLSFTPQLGDEFDAAAAQEDKAHTSSTQGASSASPELGEMSSVP